MAHIIYGKKLKTGIGKAFTGVELTSAEFSAIHETKEWRDHVGDTMTVDEYDHAISVSASGYMLADADKDTVKSEFAAWVEEVATSEYGLAAGGTVFFSEFKESQQNEDAATLSLAATYRPNVSSTTA